MKSESILTQPWSCGLTTEPSSTSELGGVIAQGRLVEYQPGSVVSRTLIRKPAGTVTAFAFDAGEGLSAHTAPYDALVLGVDGEAEISIAGVAHRVAMVNSSRFRLASPMRSRRRRRSRYFWS
jgi:hypothetical protein